MNPAVLIVCPLLLPFLTAILALPFFKRPALQRSIGIGGNVLAVVAAFRLWSAVNRGGILATQFGGWPAPFGITFVVDLLAATLVLITSVIAFTLAIYASADRKHPSFHSIPLTHFMVMGVTGAFLTGDFFNLYVWFEVFLISSFALLVSGSQPSQLKATLKYVALNLIGSTVFLFAAGLLYNSIGTLNMADVYQELQRYRSPALIRFVPLLFLFSFALKAAVFPLGNWLAGAYPTPRFSTSALFAALLTKVGVYSLLRTFGTVFSNEIYFTHDLLLWLGALTMITGVLGAAAQWSYRKILSIHIISQVGYMILALGLATPLGLGASVYFMVHNILVKTTLFCLGGYLFRLYGTEELRELGGLWTRHRALAVLFLLAAFSLAGLPPLSGFWGKLLIAKATTEIGFFSGLLISFGVSIFTLYSMLKIWAEVFWKKKDLPEPPVLSRGERAGWFLPILILTGLSLWMGFFPEISLQVTEKIGNELSRPFLYQEAVLRRGEVFP